MSKGRMCCVGLGLCYLSQSGYLLEEGGNDGFSEFLFKVIVTNGCSQKPLSLCRDLYSCSIEQSLLLPLPSLSTTFVGLRMVIKRTLVH